MLAACIYRPDGTVFASYPQARRFSTAAPARKPRTGSAPRRGGLLVSQHIELKGQTIGTLAMLYDLGELYERMRIFGSTVSPLCWWQRVCSPCCFPRACATLSPIRFRSS